MKSVTFLIVEVIAVIVIGGLGAFGLIGYNMNTDGANADDGPKPEQATPEDPEPTAIPDPVESCLGPVPAEGDGPGATPTLVDDRPIDSDAVEYRMQSALLQDEQESNSNLSVLARQRAHATVGGDEYTYSVERQLHPRNSVLTSDLGTSTLSAVADMLYSEFTTQELEQIRADHDAVGVGVYVVDNEIHVTVATLDREN